MIGGQLKSGLNMKNFTIFAPLEFLCNKWRGSNLRPLTNPNKYHHCDNWIFPVKTERIMGAY